MLSVLIATHHFFDLTGSETFAFTLAKALVLKGCKVSMYSPFIGGVITERARGLGVRVWNDLEAIRNEEFNIIHLSHNLIAKEVRLYFQSTPIFFLSHGVIPFLEQPPSEDLNISKYLAVSEEVKDNLLKKGIQERDIMMFRNIIDTDRFYPYEAINSGPKKLLVNSRRIDQQTILIIEQACKRLDVEMEMLGNPGNIQENVEEYINRADICISLGRGVLEAMACGRAAIVFDYDGGDGLVTINNIDEIQKYNFSGRRFKRRFGVDTLIEEIQKYDQNMGLTNRKIIEDRFSSSRNVDSLIKAYEETINLFRKTPIDSDGLEHFRKFIVETRYFSSEADKRNSEHGLREKDTYIAHLEGGMKGKETLIGNLEGLVKEKDTYIAHLEGGMKGKETLIGNLEGLVKEKERALVSFQSAVEEKEREIRRLDEVVNERNARGLELTAALSEKETQFSKIETLVREKGVEIGRLRDTINQKTNHILHLEGILGETKETLNRIYDSQGWKALLVYYKARNKLFPQGTKRRSISVNLGKTLKYCRRYGIAKTFRKINLRLQEGEKQSRENNQVKEEKRGIVSTDHYPIPFIYPLNIRPSLETERRLNLLIPSLEKRHLYGGIATALSFFKEMAKHFPKARLIVTDSPSWDYDRESLREYEIVFINDRSATGLEVGTGDVFVATAWWTAYILQGVLTWQEKEYRLKKPYYFYLIQDYEPGFYSWSTLFALAETTYRSLHRTVAVFNTEILKKYFEGLGYRFYRTFSFKPAINRLLLEGLEKSKHMKRETPYQIVIYGRPSVERNCFNLIVHALGKWTQDFANCRQWSIISAGEPHPDVLLNEGVCVKSAGKLSLPDYQSTLARSSVGISIMVSPHPSYPPLEMAAYGLEVVTNSFSNKDLSSLAGNITSIQVLTPENVAQALVEACAKVELRGGEPAAVADRIWESEEDYKRVLEELEPFFKGGFS